MPVGLGRHIPNGVAEPASHPKEVSQLRQRLSQPTGRLLVGLISATGDYDKGHHVLLEALAQARADIDTVVVGPHPGDSFLEHVARLGLADRVTIVGPVDSAEVGLYLRALDLLVVPSTAFESLPLVVLEAMAAGRAVFASRLAGIPEAVVDGETGHLFTPGAASELAMLLREASTNRERVYRLGLAGHRRWRERFSRETMVASMLELYRELNAG
jgi:glycosyltransferase involved in cell wall biosynthesis